jgi:Tfp pilus assembly protein PilO
MAKKTGTKPNTAAVAGARRPGFSLQPSRHLCFALGGAMGVLFAGGSGLYVWQSGRIAETNKQVAIHEGEARASERAAAQLGSLVSSQNEMRTEIRYLETSVAPGEYVPTLLRQTEVLAKSVNLQVAALRPTLEPAPLPPADKEARKKFKPWPYDKIHIEMEVRGGYWNIAKLLYRLTEFPKILSVESVQVQPAAGGSNILAPGSAAPQLAATLRVTGYLFKNEPAAAAALKNEKADAAAALSDTKKAAVTSPTRPTMGEAAG